MVSAIQHLALCSNVYEPTKNPERYTYRGSGSTPGVIVYEGRWVYSNHTNKDPLAVLLNSWDLVRLVLFGHLDNGSRTRVPGKPSYMAMCEYAQQNPKYKGMLSQMEYEEANRTMRHRGGTQ